MTNKDNQISDLPSAQELKNALPLARAVRGIAKFALKTGLGGEKAQQIADSADQLLRQSDILDLPDRFNAAFTERGWIATSSMSVDAMRAALDRHDEGDTDAGEEIILTGYSTRRPSTSLQLRGASHLAIFTVAGIS